MEITPITFHYLFDVNCYLLKTSGGFFLVDTGLQKRQGSLDEALLTAGCHPGDLKLIILTHGHTDHIGNAGHIRERFDAKIAMHIGDARMAETGNMFIDANGVKEIVAGYLTRMLGLSAPRFTADVPLEDDQDLSPYGLAARVIHTPGHSAGSICILTTEGDILSGDLYDNTQKPGASTLVQSETALRTSLKKIDALDVKIVYPGHGQPFRFDELD